MTLLKTASSIGLYAYGVANPGASLYASFYSLVTDWLSKFQIQPTYIGIDGEGYSEDFTKYGGREHKRAIEANFENITDLSIAANPDGSNAPAFDKFFDASVGFMESMKQLELCFVINEFYLPFGSKVFEETLKSLVELYPWNFGIAFSDTIDRNPELHLLGTSDGELSQEEECALDAWYSSPPEERVSKLRDIYPYNVVNEQQLGREVESGVTLKQLIEELPVGTLEPLPQRGLYLWKILDESGRKSLRAKLKERSIVIS